MLLFLIPLTGLAGKPVSESPRQGMSVQELFHAGDGSYIVLLATLEKPLRYLPVWIGEREAMEIQLRLSRRDTPRPMTLNLLEAVLTTGEIEVIGIVIDDLKAGVFLGQVELKANDRNWTVDARPSDAIGLALGKGAPIWVSSAVLERAAFSLKELKEEADKVGDDHAPQSEEGESVSFEETL